MRRFLRLVKCLADVSKNVLCIFDTDTESNKIGTDAGSCELLIAELPVGRACRVQDAGACIGDMNDNAGKAERVHESTCCFSAAGNTEGDDAAGESVGEISL